jgi:hypothetical protein
MKKILYIAAVLTIFINSIIAQDTLSFQFVNPVPTTTVGTSTVFESGYLGQINCGLAFQHSSRLNPYRNWENPDVNLATYVGLGNPYKWLGLGISFNLLGLTNSQGAKNNFGASSIDFQISRAITKKIHIGAGGYNLIQVNTTDNDKLRTYYLQLSGVITLKYSNSKSFSNLYWNLGVGNGRYQDSELFLSLKNESVNLYGSAALQILPRSNLIVEWTGSELAIATSIIPFKKLDFHFMTGFSDLNFKKKRWIVIMSYSFLLNKKKYLKNSGAKNIRSYLIVPQ